MTPDEFRTARKALGMTQHSIADALGMGRWGFQSVGKWERGEKPIPTPVSLAIQGMLK